MYETVTNDDSALNLIQVSSSGILELRSNLHLLCSTQATVHALPVILNGRVAADLEPRFFARRRESGFQITRFAALHSRLE